MRSLTGKSVLVTGGTGSLGQAVVRRLLSGELGQVAKVIIFSRDEAKQHAMRAEYMYNWWNGNQPLVCDPQQVLDFHIGDVRDYNSIASALHGVDVVFNAAALKQVPACEYFPQQAVMTNIQGAQNIVRAIRQQSLRVETVVGISTDKACKPVNVMGMTKALQERTFIQANLECPGTRFVCVRYGNVLASRGSVVPLFREQIARGGPVTITTVDMTRFLLTLEQAVDTICAALTEALPGEIYIPRIPSARVVDVAAVMIGTRPVKTVVTGIRPGEKIHEILVSEEECHRTVDRGAYYAIRPNLPEISAAGMPAEAFVPALRDEYGSANELMSLEALELLLEQYQPAGEFRLASVHLNSQEVGR